MDNLSFSATYLACATPFLIGSLTIGLLILVRYRHDKTAIAAGWFTLKPVLSALIYAAILAAGGVTLDERNVNLASVIIFSSAERGADSVAGDWLQVTLVQVKVVCDDLAA